MSKEAVFIKNHLDDMDLELIALIIAVTFCILKEVKFI